MLCTCCVHAVYMLHGRMLPTNAILCRRCRLLSGSHAQPPPLLLPVLLLLLPQGSHLNFTIECLAGHDYTVAGEEANEVHLIAEAKNFRSLLNEQKRADELSKKDWNMIYRVRVYVNMVVLVIIIGCGGFQNYL